MAIKVEALVVLLCMILHLCGPSGGTQFSHRMPWHVDQGTVDGNAISEDGKVTLAPDEDGNCIGWMSGKFWGTVKWYFANARLIIVLGIDGDGERGEIDSATSYFVNFLHSGSNNSSGKNVFSMRRLIDFLSWYFLQLLHQPFNRDIIRTMVYRKCAILNALESLLWFKSSRILRNFS